MPVAQQGLPLAVGHAPRRVNPRTSSTFADNLRLPVHRWFRFSAGFSAAWAHSVIHQRRAQGPVTVLDPFAGSATTLLAAEGAKAAAIGIEAHPFLARIGFAKLQHRTDPARYSASIQRVLRDARDRTPQLDRYPALIHRCYTRETLAVLDAIRQAIDQLETGAPDAQLAWLTLVSILRATSHVNTASWQYLLPNKSKRAPRNPWTAFSEKAEQVHHDMLVSAGAALEPAQLLLGDARSCAGVPAASIDLVLTSPPYPNNFDYADATRLEMTFFGEVSRWADLQAAVRRHLIVSCSQHVPEGAFDLAQALSSPLLAPIAAPLAAVSSELATTRLTRGGRKTYHLMIAGYFLGLAEVWRSLRRVCRTPSSVCFVVGDSAPYGVHVPVIEWLGALAVAAGFRSFRFEKTRERNVKWRNRKHRVPLCEGRLSVEG